MRAKAATLPTNLSLGSSGKSKSVYDGISKSSTYEKISSEAVHHGGHSQRGLSQRGTPGRHRGNNVSLLSREQREGSYESPETGVRRGEVFELCDDFDEDSNGDEEEEEENNDMTHYDGNSSMDNVFDSSSSVSRECVKESGLDSTSDSTEYLDMGGEPAYNIDSSTFRKKKKDSSISELALPNADETCRSMCSFNDSLGSHGRDGVSFNSSLPLAGCEDDNSRHLTSQVSIESSDTDKSKRSKKGKSGEEKPKTKSKVAQSLKKLFGSGRHNKDKEKEKDQLKSKGKIGKEKDIGPSVVTSNESGDESKMVVCNQGVNTGSSKITGSLRPEHKASPSAIVAPFNYSPPAAGNVGVVHTGINNGVNHNVCVLDLNPNTNNVINTNNINNRTGTAVTVVDTGDVQEQENCNQDKPMTKTEMLLARRRKSHLNSTRSDEGEITPGCMVTTV